MEKRKQSHLVSSLALLLLLCGCGTMYQQLTKPRPWGLADTPEGSPIFQQGWEDGCGTGLRVYGGLTYRLTYKFKQDQELINDQEYYTAWRDAYTYCRWYAWNWIRPTRQ